MLETQISAQLLLEFLVIIGIEGLDNEMIGQTVAALCQGVNA